MANHLDKILTSTRHAVAARKEATPFAVLDRQAALHIPRGFAQALRTVAASGPAMIAELKKASPSKGLIRADFNVESLAQSLEQGGAAALSVLTEEKFFLGSLANLTTASARTRIPCLCKDFIVDEYQVLEARAHGADAVLLIVAALTDAELRALAAAAHALDLDVLCEVHTGAELDRVMDLGADAVGVNNRDLASFETRLAVSLELAARLPREAVHVSESGIRTVDDLSLLRSAGFDAFLVGESLMRQADPGVALAELLAATRPLIPKPRQRAHAMAYGKD